MSKPSLVEIDFAKSWRSSLALLSLLPVTFAVQSYIAYLTLPKFFGTTFEPGFTWEPVQLTGLIWAGSTIFITLSIPITMLRHQLMRRVLSPEAADRMELRRKQNDYHSGRNMFLLQPGRQRDKNAVITFIKTIPFNLVKMCVVLYTVSYMMPHLFVDKSLSTIFVYAIWYVAFEVSTSYLKTTLCFRDIRRNQAATTSTAEPSKHKSSALGQALSDMQEEEAIEITRLNLAIEFAPSEFAYIARGKANHRAKENILALEDYDKALALNPDSIEAYRERSATYLSVGLKTLAKIDLSKAAQLCATADKLEERDKLFEELRDMSAKSNPHNSKGAEGHYVPDFSPFYIRHQHDSGPGSERRRS